MYNKYDNTNNRTLIQCGDNILVYKKKQFDEKQWINFGKMVHDLHKSILQVEKSNCNWSLNNVGILYNLTCRMYEINIHKYKKYLEPLHDQYEIIFKDKDITSIDIREFINDNYNYEINVTINYGNKSFFVIIINDKQEWYAYI